MDPVEHFSRQGFIQFLAFEPVSAGGGAATIRLVPKPEHLNHNGTINPASCTASPKWPGPVRSSPTCDLASQSYTVVKRATIEYLAPARGVVEATGTVDPVEIEQTKTKLVSGLGIEVELPVVVTDARGSEVATVAFTVAIRQKRKSN